MPDWIGNFQNPDFPAQFAGYARAFAERFPWVQFYTPVNEMYVCATYSAANGWWNEQLKTDKSFVTALKHIVRANVEAMQAILAVRPDAIFVQSEASVQFHAENPAALPRSDFLNQRRFLSLDLNYGRPVGSEMYRFLLDNGMTDDEYDFLMKEHLHDHCIMGNDYYQRNETWVTCDGAVSPAGEIFGYHQITREYFERYRLPVMHTETNAGPETGGDEAVRWLRKEWANVHHLRDSGVPIVGFTWYSLTDQVDWDTSLREPNGNVNPLGLYDLDRKIWPVGRAYQKLVREWGSVLPRHSRCLVVPTVASETRTRPQDAGGEGRAR